MSKNLGTAFFNAFEMPLMYMKNDRGPSTGPCGTPHSPVYDEDVKPFTMVNCFQLYKFDLNQPSGVIPIPY